MSSHLHPAWCSDARRVNSGAGACSSGLKYRATARSVHFRGCSTRRQYNLELCSTVLLVENGT